MMPAEERTGVSDRDAARLAPGMRVSWGGSGVGTGPAAGMGGAEGW